MKGSGFLIDKGLVVTNNHVIAGCSADQMRGLTSKGEPVTFSKSAVDEDVDLALLRPSKPLAGGLHLAAGKKPKVGSQMCTWGYPLTFNGPAPILSTAVLAGFTEDGTGAKKVKHLILNGAINPGNSGGPIFEVGSNAIVGIVVAKFLPYSPEVQRNITLLANNPQTAIGGSGSGNFTGKDAQGNEVTVYQSQVVAMILQNFYNGTQVSLGEGISVEELSSFLDTEAAKQL